MVSMTSDPESEEVTKNTTMSTRPKTDMTGASGSVSSSANRAISGRCACTAAITSGWPPSTYCDTAVPPKAFIQSAATSVGMISMQAISSRTVRPA